MLSITRQVFCVKYYDAVHSKRQEKTTNEDFPRVMFIPFLSNVLTYFKCFIRVSSQSLWKRYLHALEEVIKLGLPI